MKPLLLLQREKRSKAVHETLPRRAAGCSGNLSLAEFFTGCGGLFEDSPMPKNDGKTPQQRFSERYTVDPVTGCWNWTAGINGRGYAYLWVPDEQGRKTLKSGRTLQAYKLAWIWRNGPVPQGCDLHHKCANRRCVNPSHIEPLTRQQHQRIGNTIVAINARKTTCPRGHLYSGKNSKGSRICSLCERNRMRIKRKGGQGAV